MLPLSLGLMINSDDLRFFAAIQNSPSLAAAARQLNVSAPAVTQRLRALETRLGVHLVYRNSRQLTLTEEGELFAEHGSKIVQSMSELTEALAERRGEVTGHLTILAPLGFGRRHIAPLVAEFQNTHPRLRMDLILTDRLGRTPASAWDLAIHVGSLQEATPSLSVRQLATNQRFLCAAPAYLDKHPTPAEPADLHSHACIALRENDEDVTLWRFRSKSIGDEKAVRIEPMLASNDGEVAKAWALAGRGFIIRSEWDVAEDLRAGRLVRALKDYELPDAPIVALIGTRRDARVARTRKFLDELGKHFRRPPWRYRGRTVT
jgi:DNA-binding transcriptional LysR family regulator